ncbi:Fic family protein, partial [bacterium]
VLPAIDLGYRIQASAVFSSNIEGNSIDLNSYMNSQLAKRKLKSVKEIKEIDDLVTAYQFAKSNMLNQDNFLKAHKLLSQNLLIQGKQGKYRNEKLGVFDTDGLVYWAVEPEFVKAKMSEFFDDISNILLTDMPLEEVFYHASFIHLIFVHIHPFSDGNGRAARLLEKWFLAQKIGEIAWGIQSEKYYKEHQSEYYDNINLGVNYYELDYDRCIPFLLMLVSSMI